MKKQFLGCVVTMLMTISATVAAKAEEPRTWWVNAKNYIEGLTTPEEYAARGFDGTTPERGFGTIQIGVDKAAAGDTINVKEGVYDKGSRLQWSNNTRVVVDRDVTIVGVDGWQKTFIVGYQTFDEEGDDGRGNGSTAVRCVAATGSMRMSNFTICGGATQKGSSTSTSYCGGGVTADGASCVFTECMISNNICARFGSGAYKGKYLRCRFVKNTSLTKGAATYAVSAFSCVFSGNNNISGTYSELEGSGSGQFLNCTIVGNPDPTFGASTGWNCVFSMNGNEKKIDATKIFATVTSADSPFQLVSAPCGDFRLIPQATAIGAGEMAYLTTEQPFDPSDPDGKIRDLNGNVIDTTAATLNAGACQEVVTPAYGGVLFDSQANVNGLECYGSNLTFATSWPVLLTVKPSSSDAFRYAVSGEASDELPSHYFDKDRLARIVPPYAAGSVQTNEVVANKNTRNVDASNYATPAEAIADYTSSNPLTVSVVEGDYATGGGDVQRGVANRVSRTDGGWITFVATGEVGKTIIRGKASADPRDDENYPGCGPDAVRCVNLSYNDASHTCFKFVGFTIADGRTDCGQSADDDMGGAAYGRPNKSGNRRTSLVFMDCVFTNCWAPDAGVGVNAHFIRCKFVDCGSAGVGFKNCILSSCTFENCDFKGGTFGKGCVSVSCTDASGYAVGDEGSQIHLNSNFGLGTAFPSLTQIFGATANGAFADAANGDCRPISGSDAVDAARRAFPSDETDYASLALVYSSFATCPLDAADWTFCGGFPIAGAYMDWVAGVTFTPNVYPEGYTFVGGKTLAPGESVTIARKADAVRHVGLVVNGVTNMLDTGAYVYTQPATGGMNDGAIVGVVDPNWYVNPDPTVGDDAASGFTPQTAKWTLKGVLSVATNAGDVVHAAAGLYKDGTMHYSDSYGDARAVLAPNVTLLGEGPDESIIEGGRNPNGNSYYQGEGAMRCVMLKSGALVSGFTLTNGHSSVVGTSSSTAPAYNGGAVWGADVSSTYVVNCKIIDSRGFSGAAFHVSLFDCIVDECYGNYGAVCYCNLYGCVVNNSRSAGTTALVYRPYECFDTTIGPRNAGKGQMLSVSASDSAVIVNTLALGVCAQLVYTTETGVTMNSAFVGTRPEEGDRTVACQFVNSADDFKLDENVRPIPRVSSLVGAADETRMPSNARAKDLLLSSRAARKLNAGLDIGAYGADWKPVYAQDIANRGMTVATVSSDVVESADRTVVLGDGMGLSGVWNGKDNRVLNYELRFKVSGTGTLSVTVNGETRVFGSGDASWNFNSAQAANDIAFAYVGEGSAEILKGARSQGLILIVR